MFKSEKGVTLIELLAALALLSLILLLANSVHLFGQKEMKTQTNEIQNQSDDRLAIKIITKEIRKAQKVEIAKDQITINSTDVYYLSDTTLKKDIYKIEGSKKTKVSTTDISNIKTFKIKLDDTDRSIILTIGSIPETKIFLRE